MNIQSLSICVPTDNKCVNRCKFCVSRLHENPYENRYHNKRMGFKFNVDEQDYSKRLRFSRDNGCNTVILTGTGEPIQNKGFLRTFARLNALLPSPFLWIEIQTTGIMLDKENLAFLRRDIGVNTISLSVSDLFDDENNADIIGILPGLRFNLKELCELIKKYGFNLRLSLNLVKSYEKPGFLDIIRKAKELGADQITFRKLYDTNGKHETIDTWINENKIGDPYVEYFKKMIKSTGRALTVLPFGAIKYSVDGISVVVDEDCMAENIKDTFKYLVLRENCKLYSDWSDKGSLIF